MNGRLLVFEGIDGAGKSTQLELLAGHLEARGRRVQRTCEPYQNCPAGRRIRDLARSGTLLEPEAELALFVEQRRAHVDEVVKPALQRGDWVLSDRYYFSSVAYQGARGLPWEKILADHEAGDFPRPDLALLLDVPPELGLARVQGRRGPGEPAFEEQNFLTRAHQVYLAIRRDELVRIDATADTTSIAGAVRRVVHERLGEA